MAADGTAGHLRVEHDGPVCLVRLNRPDRLNALSHELMADLRQVLRAADQDAGTRAIVLTGEGRAFSAGADLRAAPGDAEQVLRHFYNPLILELTESTTPVVAAVNGIAAGAGASLALACDLRVAADTAAFELSFVKVGLVPDAGATWLLPRVVGSARAAEMMLLGRRVPAAQALAWGLVNEVTDPASVRDRAVAVAADLAALPGSVGATRRLLSQSPGRSLAEQLDHEATAQGAAQRGPGFAEARRAFTGKRPPRPA